MKYRIVLFSQEKISFFIVFRLNDDLSPVEVAGGVMPKRIPWLVLGPDNDNDDENYYE